MKKPLTCLLLTGLLLASPVNSFLQQPKPSPPVAERQDDSLKTVSPWCIGPDAKTNK
jgi:hypothetical protein